MPTTEYSPIIEAGGTLDGLRETVGTLGEAVTDLRALVGRFETTNPTEASELVGDLDDLTDDLLNIAQEVGSTVGVAIEEVDAAIEALPDDSQLIDAVLDVERGLGTWADVVALARKLA
jgi:hypothetical protein